MKPLIKSILGVCCGILLSMTTIALMGANLPLEQTARATLRIYNTGYYAGMSPGYGIKINEQIVVKRLKNKSWVEVEVPSGTLTIETVSGSSYPTYGGKSYSMQIEAGKLYYLEAVLDYGFFFNTMHLVLREPNRAETELKRLKQEKNGLQKIE